jgi:hypothetical protein
MKDAEHTPVTQSAKPKKQSTRTSPAKKITSNVAKQMKPKETLKAKRKVRHLGHCTSGL